MPPEAAIPEIDAWGIAFSVFGGLAVFLLGMDRLSDALQSVAGDTMRSLLARLTGNRFAGVLTGAFVTAVIQSSSVTTVLLVGFVTAGLMTLGQSVGVIMGANIGSTVTAQVIAFKVTAYALPMIAIGFAAGLARRYPWLRGAGFVLLGLGMVFLGMELMAQATAPLRDHPPFTELMTRASSPLAAVAVGAVFTAIVQSSSATTGIVIAFAAAGLVPLETAIAICLGANLGTCVTALLAAAGKPRAAMRVALVHVAFNAIGVLVWIWMIPLLADLARWISGASADDAATLPREIANAHTVFNVANTLLLVWFVGPIAALVTRVVPERAAPEDPARPKYLDDSLLATPPLAVDAIRRETARLGEMARDALKGAIVETAETAPDWAAVEGHVRCAGTLYERILAFTQQLVVRDIGRADADRVERLLLVAGGFSALAEMIGLNLESLGRRWRERRLVASAETARAIRELADALTVAIDETIVAVRDWDAARAARVVDMKHALVSGTEATMQHLARRLRSGEPAQVDRYLIEAALVDLLKRAFTTVRRAARTVARSAAPPAPSAAEPAPAASEAGPPGSADAPSGRPEP